VYPLGDFNPMLNTSSYVNVTFEPEEVAVAKLGMHVNIADQTIYAGSFRLHNDTLNMIADLWHCPRPASFEQYGCYPGAGTVGSTEACLLAALALKLRWRSWYARTTGQSVAQVRGVYPNLVISTCFQACWEKFFRYMDVEPNFVAPSVRTFAVDAKQIAAACNERTIGVIAVLGNHYGGQYDPVRAISDELRALNARTGWQIGIHVDAASGGFVAPFRPSSTPWDFRVPAVLSISASGHKFGESVCGTGWVVWREREDLSEHVAVDVAYLGGKAESFTLNFSRPASGVYVQLYKFLRLGRDGYSRLTDNMLSTAHFLRTSLAALRLPHGTNGGANGEQRVLNGRRGDEGLDGNGSTPIFTLLDAVGEAGCRAGAPGASWHSDCLPVVAACLNPELELPFDCIDLQHVLAESHWYVSGYKMSFHHPESGELQPLFTDAPAERTMLRIVVKSSLTRQLAGDLVASLEKAIGFLLLVGDGYAHMHARSKTRTKEHATSNGVVC